MPILSVARASVRPLLSTGIAHNSLVESFESWPYHRTSSCISTGCRCSGVDHSWLWYKRHEKPYKSNRIESLRWGAYRRDHRQSACCCTCDAQSTYRDRCLNWHETLTQSRVYSVDRPGYRELELDDYGQVVAIAKIDPDKLALRRYSNATPLS